MSSRAGPKKPMYEPSTVEQRLGYLVEECGEVLQAAGKSLRWGLDSVNPELPADEQEMNRDWLKREMRDLRAAIKRVLDVLPSRADERVKFKKPGYEPQSVTGRLGYLVGRCGDVLRTAGSSICFGLGSTGPDLSVSEPGTNRDRLKGEMRELVSAIKQVSEVLP